MWSRDWGLRDLRLVVTKAGWEGSGVSWGCIISPGEIHALECKRAFKGQKTFRV